MTADTKAATMEAETRPAEYADTKSEAKATAVAEAKAAAMETETNISADAEAKAAAKAEAKAKPEAAAAAAITKNMRRRHAANFDTRLQNLDEKAGQRIALREMREDHNSIPSTTKLMDETKTNKRPTQKAKPDAPAMPTAANVQAI